MTPYPSGSHWAIISLISAAVTSSLSSSAAVKRSSSDMNPLLSSSKFWKILSISSSVSLVQGRWVISFTNSLKVISPPSSASKTDMATQTKGLPGLYPPYSLMALRRSMGVSMPSQSSSRKSKTCLKISTSRTEHSATMYYLGSKFIFFLALKLDFWPPFSGVQDLSMPQRQLPRPLPYCDCRPTFINRSQQKIQFTGVSSSFIINFYRQDGRCPWRIFIINLLIGFFFQIRRQDKGQKKVTLDNKYTLNSLQI